MPTRRLPLPAVCILLMAMLASLVVRAPSADASSVVLCNGFSGCASAGMSNFGYAAVYRQMFWRMYAGHNCTNYVSYRMIKNGMSTTRPWSGDGNARNWGVALAAKTNQTPMVGSVAWWSSNHVAYVQKIVNANTIVISEDHYGGDFDWREIVRSGGGWPTGFIHLTDERVKNVAKPSIVGTSQVDGTLAAQRGTWSQNGASYSFQWYANGAPIAGATGQTFSPTPALVGVPVQVRVRASKAGYLVGATLSPLTAATLPGVFTSATAPVISGIAKVGATLTAAGASFAPAPDSVAVTWLADGVPIPGAAGPTLVLKAAQLDKTITAVATAQRAGYTSVSQTSAPTAPVGPEKIVVGHEPELTGVAFSGRRLAVTGEQLTPGGLSAAYSWMRDGVVVSGADGASYPLGAADVGHRISVTVTWTKPGYTPVVRTLTSRMVRAFPRITVFSAAHRQITVSVRALGVPFVHGTVTVRTPSGAHRTVTLDHGVATFTAPWIFSGERTFVLSYAGSTLVPGATVTKRITVE